jgi:hypothetical protein
VIIPAFNLRDFRLNGHGERRLRYYPIEAFFDQDSGVSRQFTEVVSKVSFNQRAIEDNRT